MTEILITDCDMGPADLERDVLAAAGLELTYLACRTAADVVEQANAYQASGLLVQYVPIDRAVFEGCPQLLAVVRYGVGLDNVDLEAAAEHGVAVAGVRDYGTNEVADQATALMLALLRRLPQWSAATRGGGWPARGAIADPLELATCTLGLFGFGAIAQAVAGRGRLRPAGARARSLRSRRGLRRLWCRQGRLARDCGSGATSGAAAWRRAN